MGWEQGQLVHQHHKGPSLPPPALGCWSCTQTAFFGTAAPEVDCASTLARLPHADRQRFLVKISDSKSQAGVADCLSLGQCLLKLQGKAEFWILEWKAGCTSPWVSGKQKNENGMEWSEWSRVGVNQIKRHISATVHLPFLEMLPLCMGICSPSLALSTTIAHLLPLRTNQNLWSDQHRPPLGHFSRPLGDFPGTRYLPELSTMGSVISRRPSVQLMPSVSGL